MSVNKGTQVLLLLLLATDEMVHLVSMYPEKWFLDCTGCTNIQMRDLFVMAVRTPEGKTFPGNLTIIPSGQIWVFVAIYKQAFVHLYGDVTVLRCRLVITDEDFSQYHSLENLIFSQKEFEKIIVMLCIFHAVWGPFKKQIFPLLPKRSQNTNLLTEEGEAWGNFLYKSFARQCTEHKTKAEYDRSHEILSSTLATNDARAALSAECITAVKKL